MYVNKVHSTKLAEKFDAESDLIKKLNNAGSYEWAKNTVS